MLRRTVIPAIVAWALLLPLASGGCSHNDVLNLPDLEDAAAPTPSFSSPDAASSPSITLTEYCPSTSCSYPFASCPHSQYPCDTNLSIDPNNCGACGFECKGTANAVFDCVAGACVYRCQANKTADCNGVVDDDCETKLGTNDNCGGCGDKCSDPEKPCIVDPNTSIGHCGCSAGQIYCGKCIDPTSDSKNCGACGNECDGSGDGGVLPPNAAYGCGNSECWKLECLPNYADCDNDLSPSPTSNGCETLTLSEANCGVCGNACEAGQRCIQWPSRDVPECACAQGETYCEGAVTAGEETDCKNLATDIRNCGSCGNRCAELAGASDVHVVPNCLYGSCTLRCVDGYGDCNGEPLDGCETNLLSDQRNCGACGNSCDLLAGQPCIAGQCAVHACGEGEVAR